MNDFVKPVGSNTVLRNDYVPVIKGTNLGIGWDGSPIPGDVQMGQPLKEDYFFPLAGSGSGWAQSSLANNTTPWGTGQFYNDLADAGKKIWNDTMWYWGKDDKQTPNPTTPNSNILDFMNQQNEFTKGLADDQNSAMIKAAEIQSKPLVDQLNFAKETKQAATAYDENASMWQKLFGYTNPESGITYEGYVDQGLDLVSDLSSLYFANEALEDADANRRQAGRLAQQGIDTAVITGGQAAQAQAEYAAQQAGGTKDKVAREGRRADRDYKQAFESVTRNV